jgi:hypothetical protein
MVLKRIARASFRRCAGVIITHGGGCAALYTHAGARQGGQLSTLINISVVFSKCKWD